MGLITSWITSVLGGIWSYVLAGCLAASISGYAVHRYDEVTIQGLKMADSLAALNASEHTRLVQAQQDKLVLNHAVAEAKAQQQITTNTITITKEIPVHVPSTTACIPVGLVRLLDAAATGVNPGDVAPGQPDDACAPVSWRSLAADLADDYGAANANAEQLNALEGTVRDIAGAKP